MLPLSYSSHPPDWFEMIGDQATISSRHTSGHNRLVPLYANL